MSVASLNRGASETQALVPHSYDDFSSPRDARRDQLVVEGKTLYVNMGYLAEHSKFFADCHEQRANPIFIDDFNYNEVLELMRVCFFCPHRKPINQQNINTVVTMASQYGMTQLMKRCEHVIATQSDLFTTNRLFELTKTLSKHQRNGLSMSVMMDRLSQMNNDQFESLPFSSIPGDVVADLYSLKLHQVEKRAFGRQVWPRIKSVLTCTWTGRPRDKRAKKSRRVPEVRFHISPEQAANKSARPYATGLGVEQSEKKKSVRIVTSTPIVPSQKGQKVPTPTFDHLFDSSPLTGGEVVDSDVEAEEG